jgi:hypothetical protein
MGKNHLKEDKMRQILIAITLLILPTIAKADSLSLSDVFSKLPTKEGVTYDWKHKRFLNTLSFGVIGYDNFALNASYIGVDGIGASLTYNLSSLPVKNVPILKYVQYLEIGYTAGMRTLALSPSTDNPSSDNQFIQGPILTFKFNF